jgi:predicted DNA-binding transcriptional regulator AlpA
MLAIALSSLTRETIELLQPLCAKGRGSATVRGILLGMDDEVVTLAEVARRVGLSPQRVAVLAHRPGFPERQRIGNAWAVSWPEAEAWFQARTTKPGRPRKQRPAGR